ncbi:MAG: porphobilinogen synthase [bacterium]|nr:porphobilinogen synthase [bacterium]
MDLEPRPRRLRRTKIIREMCAETHLNVQGMIQPYFVCEGNSVRESINGLPGINRESVDKFMESVAQDVKSGINKIMLFGVTDRKDALAATAYDNENPVIIAVNEAKQKYGDDLFVAADVCLCAYTESGHCGVSVNGDADNIDNDRSVEILSQMGLRLASVGCDCLGPSDMMDHRVAAIRRRLESSGYTNTIIMAYTAKYASSYYGPFREAAKSAPDKGDRKGYQMDFRNRTEALRELDLDESEGADIVMVKPALAYLDIISDLRQNSTVPVAAYNVSGEYASVKLQAEAGLIEEKQMVIENLTAINRAGADIILTYHLRDILKNGWQNG